MKHLFAPLQRKTIKDLTEEQVNDFFDTWKYCGDAIYGDLEGTWQYYFVPSYLCKDSELTGDIICPANGIEGGHHIVLNKIA